MSGWSELLPDLLVSIRRRLYIIEDYLNFGRVCRSWASVVILPGGPWLMLAEVDDSVVQKNACRTFLSLYNGMTLKKRIPKASGKRCLESMGWLITFGKISLLDREMSLLHPFSGVQIQLPHRTTFYSVQKAVLSANPCHTSDYVLMIVNKGSKFLSFWRPGDSEWTCVVDPHPYSDFRDVVYYRGHFYAVDNAGTIRVCDVDNPETAETHILACVEDSEGHTREMEWRPPYGSELYILESQGSLFVVMQCGVALRYTHRYGGTTHFRVFQADLAAGRLRETRDLGDTAFFLGANTSLSVQASQFPGIKPNHIYLTYNCWDTYIQHKEGGGLDMGVFNLADGSIQEHYKGGSLSRVCPPIWVTPTLR